MSTGDDLGAYFLRESVLRNEQITSPSLGWLLPSKLFWKDTEILVQSDQKNYTLNNLQQYFMYGYIYNLVYLPHFSFANIFRNIFVYRDIDVPNAWEFRKDNEKYQLDFTAPGVEVHCLYGSKVNTVEKFVYTLFCYIKNLIIFRLVMSCLKFAFIFYRLYYKPGTSIDGYPELIFGDGDGTVNIRSLEACTLWQKSQKQKIYNQGFPGVDHTEILKNHDILAYIKTVLKV